MRVTVGLKKITLIGKLRNLDMSEGQIKLKLSYSQEVQLLVVLMQHLLCKHILEEYSLSINSWLRQIILYRLLDGV